MTLDTAIDAVLDAAPVLRLALNTGGAPYVVPLCLARVGDAIYVHCSDAGRKLDLLRADPRVGFEATIEAEPIEGPKPCKWGMRYRSVIGEGEAAVVEDEDERLLALRALAKRYSGSDDVTSEDAAATVVIRVRIVAATVKSHG
ncbi:MAG: pyridoxamine 5'-phosphate oxidase family protein [Coriobacteriia bacterium]